MRSQHPGISQPRPKQQQGFNGMQLLQQQLMYKQLQEVQQQQLDPGGRQQNSLSQLSNVARQAVTGQSQPVLDGMPINNASNYTWSNEFMGAESKTTNSSLMFLAGNLNWPQRCGPPMHSVSNGLMLSHDQSQIMRPVGFAPQHCDQSLYRTPVSSSIYSLNHFPKSQGMSLDDAMNKAGEIPAEKALMEPSVFNHDQNDQRVVPEHACSQDGTSVAKQGFQGKSLFGNASTQGLNSGVMSGNFPQVNHFARSVRVQKFQGGQEEENWPGKLSHGGPANVVVNLDPTEAKLLFNTDNDGNWDGSFGESTNTSTGGYFHGNHMQSSDHFSSFPSIQSGSWSALMLDALEASSSDTGLQEECCDLSLQKTELSMGNHCASLNDNKKQQMTWNNNNLQSASSLTSRPFPLFNDADASPNHCTIPSIQQPSTKFAYELNERVTADVSHESSQLPSIEANDKQLDQSHQQKQFVGSNLQEQSFDNVSNGNWAGQLYGQSVRSGHSTDMEFNLQNMQLVWDHQQKMGKQAVSSLSIDKSNGWNINQSLALHGDNTSNTPDNDDTNWYAQRNDIKRTTHMERDHDGNTWKVGQNQESVSFPSPTGGQQSVNSDVGSPKLRSENSKMENFAAATDSNALKLNQEVKQQASHQHQLDYGNHVAVGSSLNRRVAENMAWYQNQLTRDPQTKVSSIYSTDKSQGPGERFDIKRESSSLRDVPNEGYASNHSHPSQHTDGEGAARDNSLVAGNDPSPLVASSQKSSGQFGQKNLAPRRFQYHPMGNLEMDVRPADSPNQTFYSQGINQSAIRGLKNQGQGYVGHSQFASNVLPSPMDLGKEQLTDLQINAKAADEIQSRGTVPSHDSALSSFDASATHVSLNKKIGQASHNMLKLLHKVDQSTNNNIVTHFSFSDNNAPLEMPEEAASAGSACLQQDHSSALQGFGLKLAPPSQQQLVLDHDLPLQASIQTANDFSSRNLDSNARDKDSKWLSSHSSVPLLPPANDVSESENLDNKSIISREVNKRAPYSGIKGSSLAFTPSILPHARNQSAVQQQQWQPLQQQWHHHHQQQQQQKKHISSAAGSSLMDQSANLSVRSQVDVDAHVKHYSHLRQAQGSHDGNISDQTAQGSLPSVPSQMPPFKFTPSGDTCTSAALQFHSLNSGPSQPINSSSHLRSSGQQLPIGETRSAAQSSATSGMSQQGGFSTMLHNVWSSLSAQQRLSIIQAQRTIHKSPLSMSPLPDSMDMNSWAPEKADDQSNKKLRSMPSEFGTSSANSQQFTYAEEYSMEGNSSQCVTPKRVDGASTTGGAPRRQELVPRHPSDENSAVSTSSLVRLHQQDLSRGKHARDSSHDSQKELVIAPNVDVQKQNHSLLQQVQAIEGADSDLNKRAGKRLKGADFGADPPQMDWVAGQRFIYGQNAVLRELDATSQHSSFSSDAKMLSFSRKNEDESTNTSSQAIGRENNSENLLASRQYNLQNHTHSLDKISTFTRGNDCPQLNSQMAPTWFAQNRSYKNGQAIATYDGSSDYLNTTKVTAQRYIFANVYENTDNSIVAEQRDDATQVGGLRQSTSSTALAANEYSSSPHYLPSNVISNNMVLKSKRRKTATSELLPWHKEVTQGSQRLWNISMAELGWAQATNRLIKKVEDELEMIGDSLSMTRPRRRLILTTQLMQQLLPFIPARFINADATTSYESVAYFVAKLALGDACSFISCSGSDSVHLNTGNMISERLKGSEKGREQLLLKAVERFIERSRKMESDLLRLERRVAISDVRMECQDLDRCSIMNRFAKFHGRAQTDGTGSSLNPESAPRRIFPQRHVTVHAVATNLPEGVRCISL